MKNSNLSFCFEHRFDVRDSEIDMFGVVNHSIYLTYLQHTRHIFFKSLGIDLSELGKRDWTPVVTRIDVRYKKPLTSGDSCVVKLAVVSVRRVKFQFLQKIFRLEQDHHSEPSIEILEAFVEGTTISPEGKPILPQEFQVLQNCVIQK